MTERLTIEEIDFCRKTDECSTEQNDNAAYYRIRLTVANHCSDTTLYATADITHLAYTHENRLLCVGFCAPESQQQPNRSRLFVAKHQPVHAHCKAELDGRLTSPIAYIQWVCCTNR